MGTVKYSGPVASFHCPTNAEIRSLKVHFSPKQLGEGDPSPENVREIVGLDGVEINKSGRNLMHLVGYSAVNLTTTTATRTLTNSNGTTINTIDPEKSVTITQTLWPATNKSSYQNGYFVVMDDNLKFEERYDISFRVTNIINNPLNAALSDLTIYNPKGSSVGSTKIIDGDRITFKNAIYNQNTATPLRHGFDIRICGMSCTISDFIITAVDIEDRTYEPYHGSTTDYEFGVLGKNKFNWDVEESQSTPGSSDAGTARTFTLNTYVVGMSVNNYYRQNYANWVLNPSVSNGVISFNSNAASGYGIAFPMKLAAGQTYFLSGTGNGTAGATYYDKDGNMISYQNGRLNNTITVPANTVTTLIGFYASATNTAHSFSNIQLELGSTATAYEPYDPKHTVYGGWVDLITGEVREEWINFSLTSSLNWNKANRNSSGIYFYYENYQAGEQCLWSAGQYSLINAREKYTHGKVENPWSEVGNNAWAYWATNNTTIRLSCSDDMNILSVDDLKDWLDEQGNVSICYPLATPIHYYIAPIALQTFLGQNNVWSNADYVEVEYDLHETQNILARKQFIIANQPHLEEVSGSIATFNTDMVAPLKECKVYFSPVQEGSGDPSPDNVRPISGWTGVEVYRTGKNLFSFDVLYQDPSNISLQNTNNRIFTPYTYAYGASYSNWWQPSKVTSFTINTNEIRLTTASSDYGVGFAIPVKGGQTICLNYVNEGNTGRTYFAFYRDDGKYLTGGPNNGTSRPVPDEAVIGVLIFSSYNKAEAKFSDISVTFENSLSYEPYSGTTLPITFPSEAGTIYGGYVDLVTGEVWETYHEINITELGSYRTLSINKNNNTQVSWFLVNHLNAPEATGYIAYSRDGYCSCASFYVNNYYWDSKCQVNNSTADLVIEGELTAEEVDNWIKAHAPIQIVYPLKTPQLITTLTPTQLKTLRGTNNIWSTANGDVEIAYWAH